MICRYWRGWTTRENEMIYQKLLTEKVIPGIEARQIDGLMRIEMMKRDLDDQIEFATIMWFTSVDAIKKFVGNDYEVAHVPDEAQAVLSQWDDRCAHYEIFDQRKQS